MAVKLLFPSPMLQRILKDEDRNAQAGNHALNFVSAVIVIHDGLRKRAGRLVHNPIAARLLHFKYNLNDRFSSFAGRNDCKSLAFVSAKGGIKFIEECRFNVARHGRSIALLPCLALAACQTPAVQTRTVEVKVPVAVQPIKPAQVPAVPAPLGPRPQSLSATADLLLAKHCEWVAYALLTDPLLRVSAGMPQRPLVRYPECER